MSAMVTGNCGWRYMAMGDGRWAMAVMDGAFFLAPAHINTMTYISLSLSLEIDKYDE